MSNFAACFSSWMGRQLSSFTLTLGFGVRNRAPNRPTWHKRQQLWPSIHDLRVQKKTRSALGETIWSWQRVFHVLFFSETKMGDDRNGLYKVIRRKFFCFLSKTEIVLGCLRVGKTEMSQLSKLSWVCRHPQAMQWVQMFETWNIMKLPRNSFTWIFRG